MNLLHKIIAAVIIAALCFLLGRVTAPQDPPVVAETARIDTLVLRDTVTVERPVVRTAYVRDSIYVTRSERDTVYISLPREVKVYEDSRYRAEVSGYEPSLDRIYIYTQERVVTKDVTQVVKVKHRTRWGIGVTAGYGVAINMQNQAFRPAPYIGIGIQYNFLSW